jgi:hypothetical protein
MAGELLVKDTLFDAGAPRIAIIPQSQTIGQLIAFIARTQGVDVSTMLIGGCILNNDDPLDAFCDSSNQIFAFSKSVSRSLVQPAYL